MSHLWNDFSLSNFFSRLLEFPHWSETNQSEKNGSPGTMKVSDECGQHSTHWKWSLHVGDEAICNKDGRYSWNLAPHFKHC